MSYSSLESINRAWTNRCTFAADGSVGQDDTELMTFMGRSLLAMNHYIINQLPPRIKARINNDEMMHSVSFQNDDHRLALGPWEDGPGWRREGAPTNVPRFIEIEDNQVNQNEKRRAMLKRWDAFSTKMGRHIPRAVHFNRVTPAPDTDEDVEPEETVTTPCVRPHVRGIESVNEGEEDYNMAQFKISNGPGGRPWSELSFHTLDLDIN